MKVYLDNNATTPTDPRVVEAMRPYWSDTFGNASSLHSYGRDAEDAAALARVHVARGLGVRPDDLVFTSGGTEANNLALAGVIAASRIDRPHLLTTAIEHPSVLNTARALEKDGACDLTLVAPDAEGRVDPERIRDALRPETAPVSVMTVNNETGAIQPVSDIAVICREREVPFHTDAVQALGKIPGGPADVGADLATFAAHKIHGPKGVGALWIRRGVRLAPRLFGGEQQRERRPGTLPVALIAGFGEATRLAVEEADDRNRVVRELSTRLFEGLVERVPRLVLNGPATERIPHTLNIGTPGAPGDAMLMQLDQRGIAVSTGSACASGSPLPSHVLLAMGLGREAASCSLRLGLSSLNDENEMAFVLDALPECVARLRSLRGRGRRL